VYNRDKIIATMQEIYDESKSIAPYVVIAQPRRNLEETAAQNFDGYEGLHIDLMGFSHGFCNIGGEKVDVARNYLIEQALESGAKYLFFIGEDTVIPYDGFKVLHETAEKNPGAIVTGVYYIKCSDAMIMVRHNDWITIPNVDPGQLIQAWQTGMDAMLIPIQILKDMKAEAPDLPFCCIGNNVDGPKGVIPFIGEDNFFVHRLHKRGTKLLVNTDVQCLHMDLASGMYTAHPSVDLKKYYTNIKPTRPLTLDDKDFIDRRWHDRLPEGTGANAGYGAIINRLIEEGQPVKFNMGCGMTRIPGYIGVDKHSDRADIRKDVLELTLPENCAEEILASHVIEHLPQHRAPEILTKWKSALKPGGKLVLETPDLEALCKEFISQDGVEKHMTAAAIFGAYVENPDDPEVKEKGALSPHLWGYTPNTLKDLVEAVGFTNVHILPAQGEHPGKNFRLEAIKEAA
jgi:SAM-dependent methyltransferase